MLLGALACRGWSGDIGLNLPDDRRGLPRRGEVRPEPCQSPDQQGAVLLKLQASDVQAGEGHVGVGLLGGGIAL